MELRKLNLQDAEAEWEYTTALPADENGLTNPFHGVSYDDYMEKVLPELISYEHPVNMPDWFVPETRYYLWDKGQLVGEFRIRHYLTEALKNGAGHIGYSILKDARGKGYGTAGLKLTVEIAKTIIPEDEIYLRVNKDNIASQKVMLKNGAYIAGEDEEHYLMRIPKTTMVFAEKKSMRLLFTIDSEDYQGCTHTYIRNSARSIIIKNNRIAMIHSLKYDYYKFPGGGIETGEDPVDTVIRETMEEAGLSVIRDSVTEYGYVHRIQKSTTVESECFIQDNLYYLCAVEEKTVSQKLDDYEADEKFTLEFVKPEEAIRTNLMEGHGPKDRRMLVREAKVLELLIAEGYFSKSDK